MFVEQSLVLGFYCCETKCNCTQIKDCHRIYLFCIKIIHFECEAQIKWTSSFRHSEALEKNSTIFTFRCEQIIDKLTKICHGIHMKRNIHICTGETAWVLCSARHADIFELCRSTNYGSNICEEFIFTI